MTPECREITGKTSIQDFSLKTRRREGNQYIVLETGGHKELVGASPNHISKAFDSFLFEQAYTDIVNIKGTKEEGEQEAIFPNFENL